MTWPSFLANGKISFNFLLPIAILCGCLLFLPDDYQEVLKIKAISIKYAEFIGPAFLVCCVGMSVSLIRLVYTKAIEYIADRKLDGYVKEFVEQMDPYEWGVIQTFYKEQKDSLPLPMDDAVVQGLVSKRILVRISNIGRALYGSPTFSYCITERAKKYIKPIIIQQHEPHS